MLRKSFLIVSLAISPGALQEGEFASNMAWPTGAFCPMPLKYDVMISERGAQLVGHTSILS